jgi:hypothetical protein
MGVDMGEWGLLPGCEGDSAGTVGGGIDGIDGRMEEGGEGGGGGSREHGLNGGWWRY